MRQTVECCEVVLDLPLRKARNLQEAVPCLFQSWTTSPWRAAASFSGCVNSRMLRLLENAGMGNPHYTD